MGPGRAGAWGLSTVRAVIEAVLEMVKTTRPPGVLLSAFGLLPPNSQVSPPPPRAEAGDEHGLVSARPPPLLAPALGAQHPFVRPPGRRAERKQQGARSCGLPGEERFP